MDLSDFIALLAIVVSGATYWNSQRSEGRANLTVEWSGRDGIVVINHGPGDAREITVEVTPTAMPEAPVKAFPLVPFQTRRFVLIRRWGEAWPQVTLTWKDNRRKSRTAVVQMTPLPERSSRKQATLEDLIRALAREEADQATNDLVQHLRYMGRG